MANRETNAVRREREQKRRRCLEIASQIAGAIHRRRSDLSLPKTTLEHLNLFDDALDRVRLVGGRWVECESVENIAEGLRLGADMLEGKPGDGRSLSGHDKKIFGALFEATRRLWSGHPQRVKPAWEFMPSQLATRPLPSLSEVPSFSEILRVYREQNPGTKVEDRTMRRSLQRLGIPTRPDKRGRPREK